MSREPQGSRACELTPPGRGAVAVVTVEGPAAIDAVDAHFRAANGRRLVDQPTDRPVFGHWHGNDARREEVVVLRGARGVEVHCHGGVAASARILAALASAGCLVEPWQERLKRTAGDPIQAEADLALTAATTRRAAAILLDQRNGALRTAVESAQHELADGQIDAARTRLAGLLELAPLGLHLTAPWKVAIAGRPNVGKSSLINALVGYQRAIVFDQPGTTRDVLAAETAIDGWPVRLTDAAGLRAAAADELEAEGVARARETLRSAELVVWVLDATMLADPADDPAMVARRQLAAEGRASDEPIELLVVVNKIDLLSEESAKCGPVTLRSAEGSSLDCPVPSTPVELASLESRRKQDAFLRKTLGQASDLRMTPDGSSPVLVSALTGAGIDELLAAISQRLAPYAPSPGEPMVFTRRQFDLLATARAALGAKPQAAAVDLDRLLNGS